MSDKLNNSACDTVPGINKRKIYFEKHLLGIPWWSSGLDSALLLQGSLGLIPGWGTKIPRAKVCGQKKKHLFFSPLVVIQSF